MEKLPKNNIENYSHSGGLSQQGLRVIKQRDYFCVRGVTLTGDAPKGFVRLYEFERDGKVRRNNSDTWPLYIAKTGHKWYPIESITEHLLNRLGDVFGIVVAQSGLAVINNQLRFLSRYFLNPRKEALVHGAEIFAGYLEDLAFVESVESANLSRSFFTLQFVEKAVEKAFPAEKDQIMHDLVKLLLFDAMVGNNDRHFFNWAVVQPFEKGKPAYFSPAYDTARGLFWNIADERLQMRVKNKDVKRFVQKYCDNSKPKLGWDNIDDINHFSLIKEIFDNQFYVTQNEVRHLFGENTLVKMKGTINKEFDRLLSSVRKMMIDECLNYRYYKIKEIIK